MTDSNLKLLLLMLFILCMAVSVSCSPQVPEGYTDSGEALSPANELMIVNSEPDEDTLDCDFGDSNYSIGGGVSLSFKITPRTINCTWPDGRTFRLVLNLNRSICE